MPVRGQVVRAIDLEQLDYRMYRSGKDSFGVFTTMEYKRDNGTLAIRDVLSGGTAPNYTTRTLTYYGLDGVTVDRVRTRTLSYDGDGDWISEV